MRCEQKHINMSEDRLYEKQQSNKIGRRLIAFAAHIIYPDIHVNKNNKTTQLLMMCQRQRISPAAHTIRSRDADAATPPIPQKSFLTIVKLLSVVSQWIVVFLLLGWCSGAGC